MRVRLDISMVHKLPPGWSYGAHWSHQPTASSGYWLIHENGCTAQGIDHPAATDDTLAEELAAVLSAPAAAEDEPRRGRPGPRGATAHPKVTIRLDPATYQRLVESAAVAHQSVAAYATDALVRHLRAMPDEQ